jgi:selenocysteine lyase/cysteine desulfurase
MRRREFLSNAGMAIGAAALAASSTSNAAEEETAKGIEPADWSALRNIFPLTRDYIHLSTFLLASHPEPVSREIERHRRGFDENPADYLHDHYRTIDIKIAQSAADYMGGKWSDIALTDSTTMGLAMVYSGIQVKPGDELLQTVHDHYSTDMSLAHKAERSGAVVKRVALYDNPAEVSVEQCKHRILEGISLN